MEQTHERTVSAYDYHRSAAATARLLLHLRLPRLVRRDRLPRRHHRPSRQPRHARRARLSHLRRRHDRHGPLHRAAARKLASHLPRRHGHLHHHRAPRRPRAARPLPHPVVGLQQRALQHRRPHLPALFHLLGLRRRFSHQSRASAHPRCRRPRAAALPRHHLLRPDRRHARRPRHHRSRHPSSAKPERPPL